jgi:hypothetical protein
MVENELVGSSQRQLVIVDKYLSDFIDTIVSDFEVLHLVHLVVVLRLSVLDFHTNTEVIPPRVFRRSAFNVVRNAFR